MAQYKAGSVAVTHGSPIVTGAGTAWLLNAQPGNSFVAKGIPSVYDIASVDSDTQITLTAPWRGADLAGAQYAIQRDFTADGIPEMAQGDIETAAIFTRAMRRIQSLLGQITGVAGSGAGIFTDTTVGLAATSDGDYFWVPDSGGLLLYQNQSGAAAQQGTYPTSATLQQALNALADEALERQQADERIVALINSLHPELAEKAMVLDFENNSLTVSGV